MSFEGANQIFDKLKVKTKLDFSGVHLHTDEFYEYVSATKTLDSEDSGKTLLIDTDAFVITLPSTAVGLTYTFVNFGADAGVLITISPAAADQIIGCDITATDDTDLTNTKATAKHGDYVRIFGDGSAGWYIQEMRGVWSGA